MEGESYYAGVEKRTAYIGKKYVYIFLKRSIEKKYRNLRKYPTPFYIGKEVWFGCPGGLYRSKIARATVLP